MNRKVEQWINFILAGISLSLLALAAALSTGLNLLLVAPFSLASIFLSLITFIWTLIRWGKFENKVLKWISLVLVLPGLVFLFFSLILFFQSKMKIN